LQTWTRIRDFLTSRWFAKLAFLAYFVFACVQLMRFVAWARGSGPYVARPESPAGLLPLGHFTSFFAFVRGGGWDTLLPAGLVIIIGAITISLLFRRGFCGWICPLGTLWELFSAGGRRLMGGRNVRVPKWLDISGRVVRYVLTAVAVTLLLVVLPLSEAVAFRSLPYMLIADVKTISLIITPAFLIVAGFAGVLSALFGPVWCRYLCPLGGMYSTVAVASPCAVHRDAEACASCGNCSAACHAFIDVEHASVVRDTECDGCMECVKACSAEKALEPRAFGRVRIAPWVWPVLVVGVWLAIFGFAYLTGNWKSPVPAEQFRATINSGILERASAPSQ
jgi:polyferredoxin